MFCGCQESVKSSKPDSPEYIIFGRFAGECLGERCVEMYKLTGSQLLESITDTYPSAKHPYNGSFKALEPYLFEVIQPLQEEFPTQLLQEPAIIIGQPNARDQGGIYFEYYDKNIHRYWLIDTDRNNIPEYLQPFMNELDIYISIINS